MKLTSTQKFSTLISEIIWWLSVGKGFLGISRLWAGKVRVVSCAHSCHITLVSVSHFQRIVFDRFPNIKMLEEVRENAYFEVSIYFTDPESAH